LVIEVDDAGNLPKPGALMQVWRGRFSSFEDRRRAESACADLGARAFPLSSRKLHVAGQKRGNAISLA
jgi:hypothetical protein